MLSNFSSEVFEARMALMRGCAVNRYTSTYLDHGNRVDLLTFDQMAPELGLEY